MYTYTCIRLQVQGIVMSIMVSMYNFHRGSHDYNPGLGDEMILLTYTTMPSGSNSFF